ncbi:MAG: putative ABC transport system permease protein [Candidatus Binatia bacterium]|jgi:putative ABC transport system permease protein
MIGRLVLNALRHLALHPIRTLLVLQGVIWGTALGVFPAAVIHGSLQKAEEEASIQGTDRILIALERIEDERTFEWKDVEWLRKQYAEDARTVSGMGVYHLGNSNLPPILVTDSDALESRGMALNEGRFFTKEELRSGARVCVLEHSVDREYLPTGNPVGQRLPVGEGLTLEIIGVVAPLDVKSESMDEFGYESGHPMSRFIQEMKRNIGVVNDGQVKELRTGQNLIVPHTVFSEMKPFVIEMRADPKRVLELRDRLRRDLIEAGFQPVIYTNAALPFLYGQTLDTLVELNRVVFLLSVMVGACIVCALMVLSVVERQREIAIRRVEGARRWHIGMQFVVETGTICTIGGILGVPLGLGLAALRVWLEPLGTVDWIFPPVESAVIVAIVTSIGLIGGLLPAWRAVRVDPVEILRYE